MSSSEHFLIQDMKLHHSDPHHPVVAISRSFQNNVKIQNLETTFATLDHLSETQLKRTRISLDLDTDYCMITSPIRIVVERQTSRASTKGKIAKGGGLDGRTVAKFDRDRNVQ